MKILALFVLAALLPFYTIQANDEEIHSVRRIADFWKDKEFHLVKAQILEFQQKYPESSYNDSLNMLLGNLLFNEKDYQKALAVYESIKSPALQKKIFNHHVEALYHLGKYKSLLDKIETYLANAEETPSVSDQGIWYYYCAESLLHLAKNNPTQAKWLLDKSLAYCDALADTSHHFNSQLVKADILCYLGNLQQACAIYMEMAETYPHKKEELLSAAAHLQSSFDPDHAASTFQRIQDLGGVHAASAALNKALALFEGAKYARIIEEQEALKQIVSKDKYPLLDCVIGKSYYALNEYEMSEKMLKPLLDLSDEPHEKIILLTLISCAHHLNQQSELKALADRFESKYPNHESVSEIRYLEALTLKNCNRFQEAQKLLEQIAEKYPNFPKIENLQFDLALVKYKQNQWNESRQAFLTFAQKYPRSRFYASALQHIASAAMNLQETDDSQAMKTQLAADLERALNEPGVLEANQKAQYLIRLGKIFYELQNCEKAIAHLEKFVQAYPDDSRCAQAHLVIALSYLEGLNDKQNFALHAEKILQLNPEHPEKEKLHLNLFTVYFESNKEKAAEHLYWASKDRKKCYVQPEYLLWLGNHYYIKARGIANEYIVEPLLNDDQLHMAKRAAEIYAMALDFELSAPSYEYEKEVYKLCNLYGWLNERAKQIELLKKLVREQSLHPQEAWNLQSRTQFALAYAYQCIGDHSSAIKAYRYMAETPFYDSYVSSASRLQLARLTYDALPLESRNLENDQMIGVLKLFKDLQLQKKLPEEPIHLEAAFDYAQIRASLEPEEKQAGQFLFLLNRIKEEFTSQEGICNKDYHIQRQRQPEKEAIYQGYMMLLNATVANLEGIISLDPCKIHDAHEIYQKLIKKQEMTSYIISNAKLGFEATDEH